MKNYSQFDRFYGQEADSSHWKKKEAKYWIVKSCQVYALIKKELLKMIHIIENFDEKKPVVIYIH